MRMGRLKESACSPPWSTRAASSVRGGAWKACATRASCCASTARRARRLSQPGRRATRVCGAGSGRADPSSLRDSEVDLIEGVRQQRLGGGEETPRVARPDLPTPAQRDTLCRQSLIDDAASRVGGARCAAAKVARSGTGFRSAESARGQTGAPVFRFRTTQSSGKPEIPRRLCTRLPFGLMRRTRRRSATGDKPHDKEYADDHRGSTHGSSSRGVSTAAASSAPSPLQASRRPDCTPSPTNSTRSVPTRTSARRRCCRPTTTSSSARAAQAPPW